jgi:hypothetical protein
VGGASCRTAGHQVHSRRTPGESLLYVHTTSYLANEEPCGIFQLAIGVNCVQDLVASLLPLVMPSVQSGFCDKDDDVRAVAAAALVPVVNYVVRLLADEVNVAMNCFNNQRLLF